VDTVKLPNGNELGLLKPSTVDATWSQVKQWLASNPDKAVLMQKSVKEMTENPANFVPFILADPDGKLHFKEESSKGIRCFASPELVF